MSYRRATIASIKLWGHQMLVMIFSSRASWTLPARTQNGTASLEDNVVVCVTKLSMSLPYGITIITETYIYTHTQKYINVHNLFPSIKTWKQPRYLSIDRNTVTDIYAKQKRAVQPHKAWKPSGYLVLNQRSQSERAVWPELLWPFKTSRTRDSRMVIFAKD